MKFSKKISSFVQSGNFEISTLTGFEQATLRVAVGHLTHYTKFPYEIFWEFVLPDFTIFIVAVSPVGSSSNRRFRLKNKIVIRFINFFLAKLIIQVTKIIIKSW